MNFQKDIEKVLGTKHTKELVKKEKTEIIAPKKGQDIDKDYQYSRDNFYNLVNKGNEAIDGILDIAKEGDHPRAYEVAGDLIKNVGDVVDKLADLQDKMKKLKEVPGNTSMQVKNALFVGSTTQLQKMLAKKNKVKKKNDTN